ncbi:MAG: IS110 family transposase, partial [Magnetococcales bacterium]|nr:IS110 family transposase [Magnetococcales bacterium]
FEEEKKIPLAFSSRWCSYSSGPVLADIDREVADYHLGMAIKSNLAVFNCIQEQTHTLEMEVLKNHWSSIPFSNLKTTPGIGKILAMTILLETGSVGRFASAGNYASYCRCVGSERTSNGKKKGEGNRKNGNKYLAWAFMEAANFAVRYDDQIRRYHQKKKARTNGIVATKTVAHKLARACYYILKDSVPFDVAKAFG